MANIEVKLQPIRVPNYILVETKIGKRQDGYKEVEKYHVNQLSENTLLELCDEFKRNLLAKANKQE